MSEWAVSGLIVGSVALLLVGFYFRAFITSIRGVWIFRKGPDDPYEEVRLAQIGPWVWGRCDVEGGHKEYRGKFDGRRVTLKRRDFGRQSLLEMGFHQDVIDALEAAELARLELTLTPDRRSLEGVYYPQRVEMSRTKPKKILERSYIEPVARVWRRK